MDHRCLLDQRGPRYWIRFDDFREIAHVECDGSLVPDAIDARLDAATDAGAAAKWRQRRACSARPVHHRRNIRFVARIGDDIGRTIVIAKHGPDIVRIGLAVGVRGAIVAFGAAKGGERGRWLHARLPQGNVFKPRDLDCVECAGGEFGPIAVENELALLRAHALAFATPPVMFQSCASHRHSPRSISFRSKGRRTSSIASSARESTLLGTVKFIAFAVFRLTTNRYRVGISTGRSAGFAPWKIRALRSAARSKDSRASAPYDISPPSRAMKSCS